MAARKQPVQDFIPADPLRDEQLEAGRMMARNPDPEPAEIFEDDPDDIALANVIADLGGPGIDAKVNVYQLDQNRNKSFVRAFMPTEFSLEAVQSEYGPGDYEIHVRRDGKLATRKVIKIAVPKNQPVPVASSGVDSAKLIETMQAGFREMATMFSGALANMTANQPKPKTTMETLQEIAMMRDLMGVNNAPAGPDPMQLFEMATQIADKIQPRVGEPGTGEVILEAIKNFGPVLTQAAQNAAARTIAPVMTAIPNPAPLPAHVGETPAITPVPNPTEGPDQMNIARRMYLNLLISNAANDNDPATYAQLMLDVAGEQQALEFANAPDWFERLCAEEPRAVQYREWFVELRSMVLELTKPEMPDITDGDKATDVPTPPTENVL
jgi:hypothetical protein